MSDELDELIVDARPRVPEASGDALMRARADALEARESSRAAATGLGGWRWRRAAVAAAAMLALAAAFAGGALFAPGADAPAGAVVLQGIQPGYGVSLELPAGWSGRVVNEQTAGTPPAAYVQAASFELPANDDDVGSAAAATMGRDDVLIVLLEALSSGGADFERLAGAPQISRADFGAAIAGVPPDHALARVLFTTAGRRFVLSVQFGNQHPSDTELRRVNAVLVTLRIHARG
jgi:hypothetical protein